MFIGTPDGKNHFYELWSECAERDNWKQWVFKSTDNPFLPAEEIKMAQEEMSSERFRQEMEASFEAGGGTVMTRDMFRYEERPYGDVYIAVDLAGYESVESGRKVARLDEHAIAVVVNHEHGWHIEEIIHGQWDTRETALRMVKAYRDYRPVMFGIEKGMAMNAVLPYLEDEMARIGVYFTVTPLTHGNQRKIYRIQWALQGRARRVELR